MICLTHNDWMNSVVCSIRLLAGVNTIKENIYKFLYDEELFLT